MYKNISSIMGSAMVSRFVNINVAKGISCILIALLLIANILNYLDSGPDSCRGLLTGGRLLDEGEGIWQPDGCMMHKYKSQEASSCLENQRIAFVGDSRMRELMFDFLHVINPDYETPKDKIHSNIFIAERKVYLNFYWVPELNKTAIDLYQTWLNKPEEAPNVIFQSSAVHTIKRLGGSEEGLNEYIKNFTAILPTFGKFIDTQNGQVFWVLQEPVYQDKLSPARQMITSYEIDRYNRAAMDILSSHGSETGVKIVEAFKWVASGIMHLSSDGMHLPEQALKIESSILFNHLCNKKIHPIDGTCCQPMPPVTAVQIFIFLLGLSCIVGAVSLRYLQYKFKKKVGHVDVESGDVVQNGQTAQLLNEATSTTKPAEKTGHEIVTELLIALSKYTLIMMYFYICDRTNLFMKGNKHFTNARFFLPLLYVSLLGLFGIVQTSQTALLNRDQTDEWKGWMQLIILIYHMSGASVNVPIYMHIRILVAMYLFMTGYGHFSYFWHKADYSLHRVLNVVFRLNFLTISLCLVMDRSYQFYYFVPMCTFWFLVLYMSMAIWPRANMRTFPSSANGASKETPVNGAEKSYYLRDVNLRSPYAIMALKLVLLFAGICVFFISESYYEALFSWWPAIRLFELPEGSVREWWFRCQLDRYAMLHGAVLCFVYLIMKKLQVLDDSKQGCLFSTKTSFITMTASIGIIISYAIWAVQCTDKQSCNRIHSYASIFPITAFIIIRNVPGYLRSGYSAFFAWFGKISLELFIGQYHIWLAADTKGMLVLISPEWPTLNLVITSFIFVCVAHEINLITGILTKHVIGSPKEDIMKLLLRLFGFLASIIVIFFIQNTFNPPRLGRT